MRKRSLGPGAPDVSVVSYGAWPLSDSPERPGESDAIAAIHAALDGGATLVDTADAYCRDDSEVGHNERLVAKALATWSGDHEQIVVATKGGYVRPGGRWVNNGRPEHLRTACERSLAALGVERIDLYQFHGPDPAVPFADSVGALAELRAEGKIDRVGLSNVSVAQIEEACGLVEVTSVQNRLNPFFREAVRDGVVGYCDTNGLGFLAYSPVGGGRLNKKLPGIAELGPVAARHGVTVHAVALAWVLAQGTSVIVIPAARRVEHVVASQAAAAVELTPGELAAIDRAEFSIA